MAQAIQQEKITHTDKLTLFMQDIEHRKCTYSTLLKILKRNIPQVSTICKWENIKIGLQEISSEVWTWNDLTQDGVQQQVSANKAINNDVAQKMLNDSVLRQYPMSGVSGTNDTDILLYMGQDTHIQSTVRKFTDIMHNGNQRQEAGFKSLYMPHQCFTK
jgi:hypothetical protein